MNEKDKDYRQSRENFIHNMEYMVSLLTNNEFTTYGYDFNEVLSPPGQKPRDFHILAGHDQTTEPSLRYLVGQYLAPIEGSAYNTYRIALRKKFESILMILKDATITDDAQAIQNAYKKLRISLNLQKTLEPLGYDIYQKNFEVPALRVFDPEYNKTLILEKSEIVELKAKNTSLQRLLEEQKKLTLQEQEMKALILKSQQSQQPLPEVEKPKSTEPLDSSTKLPAESELTKESHDDDDERDDYDPQVRERLISNKKPIEIKAHQFYYGRLEKCLFAAISKKMDNEITADIGRAMAALEHCYLKSSSIADMMELYGILDTEIPEFEKIIGMATVEFPKFEDTDQSTSLKEFNYNDDTEEENHESLEEGLPLYELTDQEQKEIRAKVEKDAEAAQKILDSVRERAEQEKQKADAEKSRAERSDVELPKTPDAEDYVHHLFSHTRFSHPSENDDSSSGDEEKSTEDTARPDLPKKSDAKGYIHDLFAQTDFPSSSEIDDVSESSSEEDDQAKKADTDEKFVPGLFRAKRPTSRKKTPQSRRTSHSDLSEEGLTPIIMGGIAQHNTPINERVSAGDVPVFQGAPLRSPPGANPAVGGNQADRSAGPAAPRPDDLPGYAPGPAARPEPAPGVAPDPGPAPGPAPGAAPDPGPAPGPAPGAAPDPAPAPRPAPAPAPGPGVFQHAPQPVPINDFFRQIISVAQLANLTHDPSQDNILHFHANDDPRKTAQFSGTLDNWQITGNDVQKIVDFAIEMKREFPNMPIWIISQRRDENDLVAIQKDLDTLRALTQANVKIEMRDLEHLERVHANEYHALVQAQELLQRQEPQQDHGLGVD